MKVFQYLAAAAAAMFTLGAVSCSDSKENDEPATINHIYLEIPQGSTSITAGTDQEIVVAVKLSSPVKKGATFEFMVEGENAKYVTLTDNPVSIPSGSTIVSFTVKAAEDVTPLTPVSVSFSIKDLDSNRFDISQNVTITVAPKSGTPMLTPEQAVLVEGWKSKYGIDITPWLGEVWITSGSVQFPGSGNREPFVAPYQYLLDGNTTFALSDESTEDMPVLDMVVNPMGMASYLYISFMQLTIGDKEYFALEDDGNGLELMDLINWKSQSDETFAVTLPGLKITSIEDGKANVEFVVEGENYILNSKGEKIFNPDYDMDLLYNDSESRIPFNYTYSAWTRQLALVEDGDPTAMELLTFGVSAAPATYLGISSVLEDTWEIDEEEDGVSNLYVSPKGEIDFNAGTMKFVFPFDHADQVGYSRVEVNYSLK